MENQIAFLADYLAMDEAVCVAEMLADLNWDASRSTTVYNQAKGFVEKLRAQKRPAGELEAFLQHYSLATDEGIALMCLAEALLRIPDNATANALIKDKVTAANWREKKQAADWIVKAAGFGLLVTRGTLESALERVGAPFIREAIEAAMRVMGSQFVLGQNIQEAIKNSKPYADKGYRMSYDMLGEGARTAEDAERYFQSYLDAIAVIEPPSGISVKLSALHPRYEFAQADVCMPAMTAKLIELCRAAAKRDIALMVDAEEAERLVLSMEIIEEVFKCKDLRGWEKFGLAVQAYQKRAPLLIDYLEERSSNYNWLLSVRLVKGAYWDSEVKRAQLMGLRDYPVYTRKENTDLSYLLCAQKLLQKPARFKPYFGTHNAHTVAALMEIVRGNKAKFGLQRLHGMGEALHDMVMQEFDVKSSIYAPVGPHQDLLAYLVRRLLENGANASFVNKVMDKDVAVGVLVRDPMFKVQTNKVKKHPKIPYPEDLYADEIPLPRRNSTGIDLSDKISVKNLLKSMAKTSIKRTVVLATDGDVQKAFKIAKEKQAEWNSLAGEKRAEILERTADLFEKNCAELMAVLIEEGKKTIPDALSEVREAVDFCRYYAGQGRAAFEPQILPGPTGEDNRLLLQGRGVFVCISPWNFPLAIFTGQVVAALMAGNAVLAKPASQTPLIARQAVELMHKAGVPKEILHLMIGPGRMGAAMVQHKDCAGVAFTGSTEVARGINRDLAAKDGPIVPLIAETGGMNVMIVDSSALPEQVVDDVVLSAFGSAGQRCSALRILCLQDEIADKILGMLKGAMAELLVGDPSLLSTDVGPVIDANAQEMLCAHRATLEKSARLIADVPMNKLSGTYFAPCAFELDNLDVVDREVFGPILHVVRYKRKDLDQLIEDINGKGYGLTFGVHSRIHAFQDMLAERIQAGNIYVNRSMIGAIVGSQPFGGMGLSGTGPKAGGPHYLQRFATEKVVSIDTTAAGGNAALVSSID